MAFESLKGIKIKDFENERTFIIADFFSVYENYGEKSDDENSKPYICKWSDFDSIAETKDAFIFNNGEREIVIPMSLVQDPAVRIRVRAIIEGAVAANPKIEYKYGRRILPPKTLCTGCDVPPEAYVAVGSYKESEINNSNVLLQNNDYEKWIWTFVPFAAILTFVIQVLLFGNMLPNLVKFITVSFFAGIAAGLTIYLFFSFAAKMLYGKILKEDPAVLEEITFVVCEDGFIAAETEVYDFSDIVPWREVSYFLESNHVYIIYNRNKAVFWLPKRLFPKELHQELSDFIADRLTGVSHTTEESDAA